MNIALDTNRYVDLMRQVPEAVQVVEGADQITMTFAVLAELRCGFRSGNRAAANEKVLLSFLSRPNVCESFPDDVTTTHYAELCTQLRRAGRSIPLNDIWIASLCVQHGLNLYTRDAHFDYLPQVLRV